MAGSSSSQAGTNQVEDPQVGDLYLKKCARELAKRADTYDIRWSGGGGGEKQSIIRRHEPLVLVPTELKDN